MEIPSIEDLIGSGPAQRRAVEQLYGAFAGRLRSYFSRLGSSAAESEDLTQETFVRVLRSAREFHGSGSQFAGWVWTIARRLWLDSRRSSSAYKTYELDDAQISDQPAMTAADADPAETVERVSVDDCVKRGFARFQEDFPERAQCLSWLVTDRLEIVDIAAVLGRTVAATREYLSQCRKKLRPYLEPCVERSTRKP